MGRRRSTRVPEGFALRAAAVAVCSWLAACGTDAQGPAGGSGGGPSASGGASPGTGGAASGGTPAGSGGSVSAGGSTTGGVGATESGGASAVGGTEAGGSDGGGLGTSGGSGNSGGGSSFVLTSPAFENVEGCSVDNSSVCDVFPDENVFYLDNANISPELHWTGAPAGTQSFALVLFDVSYGQAHWTLWNIPRDAIMLAADVQQDTATPAIPAGSQQANANFATSSEDGYFGPHIQCNVYEFELYALSSSTFSPMRPDSAVLVASELSELWALGSPDVLGVAKLSGRGNMPTCE